MYLLMIFFSKKRTISIMKDASLIPTLRQARQTAGLTQTELAQAAGLSRMAVQRTETGEVDPRLSTVTEMARVLGLHLLAVPADLVPALHAFIQSGGKFLAQPSGADAPPSLVDTLAAKPSTPRS